MAMAETLGKDARLFVRTALVLWLVAAFATVWEVLALQGPDSPLRFGILAGPIAQLRDYSFAMGAALVAAAWLWPKLYSERGGRVASLLLVSGALIHVVALGYAASQGMVGVQFFDPRPDARWLVLTRGLGHLLMVAGLASATVRAFRVR